MTDNVTELRPTLEHYESCDRDVYGRAILSMVGDLAFVSRSAIIDYVREWRSTQSCDCLKFRIGAAETAAATGKKQFLANLSEENATRLDNLNNVLNRLKGLQK